MNHEKIDTYNVIYCKIHDICLPYGGLETLVQSWCHFQLGFIVTFLCGFVEFETRYSFIWTSF